MVLPSELLLLHVLYTYIVNWGFPLEQTTIILNTHLLHQSKLWHFLSLLKAAKINTIAYLNHFPGLQQYGMATPEISLEVNRNKDNKRVSFLHDTGAKDGGPPPEVLGKAAAKEGM